MTGAARSIAVCIDDVGLHAGVNRAALALAEAGRVSALACMSTAPAWREAAAALRTCDAGRLDIGLHLNLSEPFAATHWQRPLARLILQAYAGALPREALRAELRLQLDAFEAALGRAPDFVDGHQHVHQLPGVREPLLAELARRYPGQRPWLRDTRPPAGDGGHAFKPRLIAALGARRLAALATAAGHACNRGLVGVYGFEGGAGDYAARLAAWLDALRAGPPGGLLMCHPGAGEAPASDPIAAARRVEYQVLGGPVFAGLLAERGLRVGRLAAALAGA